MAFSSSPARCPNIHLFSILFILFLFGISCVFAEDVPAPKSGNCNNPFEMVLPPSLVLLLLFVIYLASSILIVLALAVSIPIVCLFVCLFILGWMIVV